MNENLTLKFYRFWHDWKDSDYDRLAGALVSGHLIECSAYVTGNKSRFRAHNDMLTFQVVTSRGLRDTILRSFMSLDFPLQRLRKMVLV
jgi:hypothetical protein